MSNRGAEEGRGGGMDDGRFRTKEMVQMIVRLNTNDSPIEIKIRLVHQNYSLEIIQPSIHEGNT